MTLSGPWLNLLRDKNAPGKMPIAIGGSEHAMRQKICTEILLFLSLLFHFQWFFGNLYEEVLTPNSIVASAAQINAYNRFFSVTEPYYYYIPLTQIGFLLTLYLAFVYKDLSLPFKKRVQRAAAASGLATGLTVYIVTQYNMRMFFGDVDRLGDRLHRLYFEWAVLNGLRLLFVGAALTFLCLAYRGLLLEASSQISHATDNLS